MLFHASQLLRTILSILTRNFAPALALSNTNIPIRRDNACTGSAILMVSSATILIASTFFALTCFIALEKTSPTDLKTGLRNGKKILGEFVHSPSLIRRVNNEDRYMVKKIVKASAKAKVLANVKIGTEQTRRAQKIDSDMGVFETFTSSFAIASRELNFKQDLGHDMSAIFPSSSPEPSVEPSNEPGSKLTSKQEKKGKVHVIMVVAFALFAAIFIILVLKSMGTLEHCLEKHFLYNRFHTWERTSNDGSSTPGAPIHSL